MRAFAKEVAMKMQGNTILVAGGASGIGRGLAELLGRLGNEVIVIGDPQATAPPGLRMIDLDLGNPFAVTDFSEQLAAICPNLNMLLNIAIAFPVRYLPGMNALLEADDSHEKLEAQRLGIQHLTGTLLPHFRKRSHSSVMNVSVGPAFAPSNASRGARSTALDGGQRSCVMSVRKRWVSASIEVVDIAFPSGAERLGSAELQRPEFISSVTHLLAEGLQEGPALSRLQALWPTPMAAVKRTRDDDRVSALA
jgi:uncharacterized oxidoreductase